MVERAGSFYPPDVIKAYEAGQKVQLDGGRGVFPRRRSSAGPPVIIVRGKKPAT
jgi:branched-chain amino acid transport system substrate-binding protein